MKVIFTKTKKLCNTDDIATNKILISKKETYGKKANKILYWIWR